MPRGLNYAGAITHINKFKAFTPGLMGAHFHNHILNFPKNGAAVALRNVNSNSLVQKAEVAVMNQMVNCTRIRQQNISSMFDRILKFIKIC